MSKNIIYLSYKNIFQDNRIMKQVHFSISNNFKVSLVTEEKFLQKDYEVKGIDIYSTNVFKKKNLNYYKILNSLNLKKKSKDLIKYYLKFEENYLVKKIDYLNRKYFNNFLKNFLCNFSFYRNFLFARYIIRLFIYAYNIKQIVPSDSDLNIIHCHDIFTLLGGVFLKKKINAKLIYEEHEIEIDRFKIPKFSYKERLTIYELLKNLLIHVDHVITFSDFSSNFFKKIYKFKKVTSYLNLPPKQNFSDNSYNIKFNNLRKKNNKIIIYSGGIGINGYRIKNLILSLKFLTKTHLVIINNDYRFNELVIKKFKYLKNKFSFLPPVKPNYLVNVLQKADIGACIVPNINFSYKHCLPNKFFEYAFARVPIVMSDLPEFKLFNKKYNLGLISKNNDPRTLAKTIKLLYLNYEKYRGNIKTNLFFKEYSLKNENKKLMEVYDNL